MTSVSFVASLAAFWFLSTCLVQCWSSVVPTPAAKTLEDGISKRDVDQNIMVNAIEYYTKVVTEYSCSSPQLRLVPVQAAHPSNTDIYTTDHVVLHQCAHDGGCCPPSQTCAGHQTEDVEIPILFVGSDGTTNAKMMVFSNHTTCHCVKDYKYGGL